jgi:hypothetical protein
MTIAILKTHNNKRKILHFINKNDLEKAENRFLMELFLTLLNILWSCILSPSYIIFLIIFREFLTFFFCFVQINIINDTL